MNIGCLQPFQCPIYVKWATVILLKKAFHTYCSSLGKHYESDTTWALLTNMDKCRLMWHIFWNIWRSIWLCMHSHTNTYTYAYTNNMTGLQLITFYSFISAYKCHPIHLTRISCIMCLGQLVEMKESLQSFTLWEGICKTIFGIAALFEVLWHIAANK